MKYIVSTFASTYGSGAYNASTYQSSSSSTSTSTSTSSGSPLANTGFDLLLAASLGSAIIFVALVIRFWRRPKKQTPSGE